MSIPQSSLSVNTGHVKELTKQIQNTTDCAAIDLVVREHLKSTEDLIAGIVKIQAKQMSNIFPILSLPAADPVSIVSWISKMVLGTAKPQMNAYVSYTIQMIKLGAATAELAAAVAQAAVVLETCALESPINALNDLNTKIAGIIPTSLQKVGATQTAIGNIVGPGMVQIDVSNQENFINSVNLNYATQQQQIDNHINS